MRKNSICLILFIHVLLSYPHNAFSQKKNSILDSTGMIPPFIQYGGEYMTNGYFRPGSPEANFTDPAVEVWLSVYEGDFTLRIRDSINLYDLDYENIDSINYPHKAFDACSKPMQDWVESDSYLYISLKKTIIGSLVYRSIKIFTLINRFCIKFFPPMNHRSIIYFRNSQHNSFY